MITITSRPTDITIRSRRHAVDRPDAATVTDRPALDYGHGLTYGRDRFGRSWYGIEQPRGSSSPVYRGSMLTGACRI